MPTYGHLPRYRHSTFTCPRSLSQRSRRLSRPRPRFFKQLSDGFNFGHSVEQSLLHFLVESWSVLAEKRPRLQRLQMLSMCPQKEYCVADGKEDAMRSIQEIIFSLMILVGLSMILYDVINARTVARTVERKIAQRKSWLAEDKTQPRAKHKEGAPQGAASGARYSVAMMHLVNQ